jgi:hypothetical protein
MRRIAGYPCWQLWSANKIWEYQEEKNHTRMTPRCEASQAGDDGARSCSA